MFPKNIGLHTKFSSMNIINYIFGGGHFKNGPQNHFCNRNVDRDKLNLQKYHTIGFGGSWWGGGGAGRRISYMSGCIKYTYYCISLFIICTFPLRSLIFSYCRQRLCYVYLPSYWTLLYPHVYNTFMSYIYACMTQQMSNGPNKLRRTQ